MKWFLYFSIIIALGLTACGSPKASEVYINEVMASNGSTIADEDGDFSDWIELYNSGPEAVSLTDWYLTDSRGDPHKWQFPQVSLEPGGYLLVWASGKNRIQGELHTNFRIDTEGEELLLIRPDGTISDQVEPIHIPRDLSFGRIIDGGGEWSYFFDPTPGSNNGAAEKLSASYDLVAFSEPGGFYSSPLTLTLSTFMEHAKIYYTLDGSEPTLESNLYTEPIYLEQRELSSGRIADIPSSLDWVAPEEFFMGNVVRAVALVDGELASPVYTHTYLIERNISRKYSLPVISLALNPEYLFDHEQGIYVPGLAYEEGRDDDLLWWQQPGNFRNRGEDWEYPLHMEFFEVGGSLGFSLNAGVRIHGGATRTYRNKSLRIYARSSYDPSSIIDYEIFPGAARSADGEPLDQYKRLLLRNSGNDWPWTMYRDGMMQSLVGHLSFDTQEYQPAVVFINGEYWGIHNIRERYDSWYLLHNYDVPREDAVILVGANASVNTGLPGDDEHFLDMRDMIAQAALDGSINNDEVYQEIQTLMDIDNFLEYYASQIYFRNTDWPGGNEKYWRIRTDEYDPDAPYGQDGRWRWLMYDTDFGFGTRNHTPDHDTLAHVFDRQPAGLLFMSLLENEKFANQFINTMADLMNTVFLPNYSISLINDMQSVIAPEMKEHIDRWGTMDGSLAVWGDFVELMRDFARRRPDYQRQHILEHFGLNGTAKVTVRTESGGLVQVNSLLLDPSTPGISSSRYFQGDYFLGIPISITALPQPGYEFVGWRGLDREMADLPDIQLILAGNVELVAMFRRVDSADYSYAVAALVGALALIFLVLYKKVVRAGI